MAFTTYSLTGNVSDLIQTAFAAGKVKATLEPSQPILSDGVTEVRLGSMPATIATDGTFTITGIPATAAGFPLYRVLVWWVPDRDALGVKGPQDAATGWFEMTEDRTLAWAVENTVEPTFLAPTVVAQIAAAAALGNNNDTMTASFVTDELSDTHAALSATFAGLSQTVLPVGSEGAIDPANDTARVQAAADALSALGGGIVQLERATHKLAGLDLPSNVHLRGHGRGQTIIEQVGSAVPIVSKGTVPAVASPTSLLGADAAPGDTTLTLASTTGLAADDWLVLGDDTVASTTQPTDLVGEMVQVRSVDSATVVTVTVPIRGSYDTVGGLTSYLVASNAGVHKVTDARVNVGLHNLTLRNPAPATTTAAAFQMHNGTGLYVSDVEADGFDGPAIELNNVTGALVTGLYAHDLTSDVGAGRYGYGVNIGGASADVIVANCRFENVRHGVTTTTGPHRGTPHRILVTGCIADKTAEAGFDTHQGAYGVVFTDCHSWRSSTNGFVARSRRTVFQNCTAHYATATGFGVAEAGWRRLTFQGCKAYECDSGFYVATASGSDVDFIDCLSDGSAKSGGRVTYGATNVRFIRPTILNAGDSAAQGAGIETTGAVVATTGLAVIDGFFAKTRTYSGSGAYRNAVIIGNAVVASAMIAGNKGYGVRSDLQFISDAGTGTMKRHNRPLDFRASLDNPTASTTQLASVADPINTLNKQAGSVVFNTTTNKPVYATGSTAASTWVDATGAVVHTPV